MIHMILLVLKIVGIVLLSLLALLLLALVCVLAVPVRYRAQGEKEGRRLWARGEVSWLFRLLCFRAEYRDGRLEHEFYLCGLRWSRLAGRLSGRKRSARERTKKREAAGYRADGRSGGHYTAKAGQEAEVAGAAAGGKPREEAAGNGAGGGQKPGPEKSRIEEPRTEKPGPERSRIEEPGTEKAGPEELGTERPRTKKPGPEEPGPERSCIEEPGTEKSRPERSGTKEPGTERSGPEEPRTEKPGTEEPEAEKPEGQRSGADGKKGRVSGMLRKAADMRKRLGERLRALLRLPGKICFTIRNICAKIKKWRTLLKSETFQYLKELGIERGKLMLRHIRPRKIQGNIRFGFEDPANTGEALGLLGLVYPVLPRRLAVVPDFTEQVLEGWLKLSGRVYGGFAAYQILRVLLDGKTIPAVKRLKKEA